MASLQQALNESIASWQFEVRRLMYTSRGVAIYECVRLVDGFPCVAKVIQAVLDKERQEHEANVLYQSQHPNIIRMYGSFWFQHQSTNYFVILFEWCEKDIWVELVLRKQSGSYWSEAQLWYYVRCLVDALAYMQEKGIAHRDIKPQNIFLAADGTLKVGDWGSSKEIYDNTNTVVGTPFFLSPELKCALISHQGQTLYDPYKSDVFSLGLTFLTMAHLEVQVSLLDLNTLEQCVEECISRLVWYSEDFKNLLRWMLRVDPSQRYSFIDLRNWLGSRNQSQYFESAQNPSHAHKHHLSSQIINPSNPEELKEVLQQQVEEAKSKTLPLPYTTVCLQKKCGKKITSGKGVVQLFCDSQHAFCSRICFNEFIDGSRDREKEFYSKCPKCQAPIDPEVTKFAKAATKNRACNGCPLQ